MPRLFDEIEGQKDGQVKIGHVLNAYRKKDDLFFVEIGANDGVRDDVIFSKVSHNNWTGILVEPIPDVFKKLESNYKSCSRVILVEAAITSHIGSVKMFHPTKLKGGGIASINKKHKPLKGKTKASVKVQCMTLDFLFENLNVSDIDLLQIDAEGHDFQVLKSMDITKYRPVIIHYEHRHLGERKEASHSYLKEHNYKIFLNRNNTVAVDLNFV